MIDHISIGVSDLAASVSFYDAVLQPLGYVRVWSDNDAAGYGAPGRDDAFAVKQEPPGMVSSSRRSHIAFAAPSEDAVLAFHATALANGARDDGTPGVHVEYGAHYFAGFVIDRDGYRLEAVFHG